MATRKRRAPGDTSKVDNIRLLDVNDESVRLGTLWKDEPVLVVWLRHYG